MSHNRGRGRGPAKGASSGMSLPTVNMNMNMNMQTMNINASQISKTAESLFSTHLASALSTISDSQFFQDSISPSTIRNQFETNSDPSNPNSIPILLNSMKWLLASMSKGRDVSDFFPHVVKLVSSQSLEIRKMVYTYLTHYADHDSTCRDLALLSINAFQRDLSDSNPYIRPLALRVLTSIRVMDVLQIQILAVQSSLTDESPHVRKCAANALAKLYPRSDEDNRFVLKDLLKNLLMVEKATEVLSSALMAFVEMCPDDLHLLHGCFRKLCHLLTDMDEWGQIVVMDVLQMYCRNFFRDPKVSSGFMQSAEAIDRQRRVVRRFRRDGTVVVGGGMDDDYDDDGTYGDGTTTGNGADDNIFGVMDSAQSSNHSASASSKPIQPRRQKQKRVVRKGFYSDDEDESSIEEEDEAFHIPLPGGNTRTRAPGQSIASTMRSPIRPQNVLGLSHNRMVDQRSRLGIPLGGSGRNGNKPGDEDDALDEDHRLLLRSSLPLLKSRNAGVVLAVCSLHYYCGVASIKIRSSCGKALVRIYHDRREIQFVVLNSIRMLVWECPSAFAPFLNDFFVKAMDPSFTRFIKLDILSALCLEPNSIDAFLKELRTYICHHDKSFVCASVRTVGKVAEMARIVYDRQGERTRNANAMRDKANEIALNCLYGVVTLSETSDNTDVVGECVEVMQRIMMSLQDDDGGRPISDPMYVQDASLKRLLLLVVRSLSSLDDEEKHEDEEDSEDRMQLDHESMALKAVLKLPTKNIKSALWILGEWMTTNSTSLSVSQIDKSEKKMIRIELLRLVANSFPDSHDEFKYHSIHFASKVLLTKASSNETTLCEFILSLGRIDVNQDVRDRARYESSLIHMAKGLQSDADNLQPLPGKFSIEDAKSMLLKSKPSQSWLPIETEDQQNNAFRFGTLSSMVSRKAGKAYFDLPRWAEVDSPKSLRDPPAAPTSSKSIRTHNDWSTDKNKTGAGFYDSSSSSSDSSTSDSSNDSDSDSDSSSSSSSSSDDDNSSSEKSYSSSDEESTDSDESNPNLLQSMNVVSPQMPTAQRRQILPTPVTNNQPLQNIHAASNTDDETSGSDSSSSDDESSSGESSDGGIPTKGTGKSSGIASLIDVGYDVTKTNLISNEMAIPQQTVTNNSVMRSGTSKKSESISTTLTSGLEGLVMAPLVVDKGSKQPDGDIDVESSNWKVLVRHDLSGGLIASIRFLRGPSRVRESNLLGLDPKNSSVVCAQIKFENKRNDGRAIRRIRLLQKKFGKAGVIPTTRINIPQEISSLDCSKVSYAIIGLEFAQASDKEGALLAKFDVKCDRGATPVEICPPLAETIRPNEMTKEKFDSSIETLQGIHQQSKAKFNAPSSNLKQFFMNVQTKILEASNMALIDRSDIHLKFAGSLPMSGKHVLLNIKCDHNNSTAGEIVVCCDNAMALNPLLSTFKEAIAV